jgi:hypothetical protein
MVRRCASSIISSRISVFADKHWSIAKWCFHSSAFIAVAVRLVDKTGSAFLSHHHSTSAPAEHRAVLFHRWG